MAFLVTHNSFSNGPKFAVWARNQRFSVTKQLEGGVRGLMLDIYPGWSLVAMEIKSPVSSCYFVCVQVVLILKELILVFRRNKKVACWW